LLFQSAADTQAPVTLDIGFFDVAMGTSQRRPVTTSASSVNASRFYKQKGSAAATAAEGRDVDVPDSVPDFAPLLGPVIQRIERKR